MRGPRAQRQWTDPLRRRIEELRKTLFDEIDGAEDDARLEKTAARLALLEGLARRRRGQRSLAWAAGTVVVCLLGAILLRFTSLRATNVGLVAETRAFVVTTAAATRNVLPEVVPARQASWKGTTKCTDADPTGAAPCERVRALRVNTLRLNVGSTASIRRIGTCFEMQLFEGGAGAGITFVPDESRPDVDKRSEAADWRSVQPPIDLAPGESMRFCPTGEAVLEFRGVITAAVGDRRYGGVAEREDVPALSKATLAMADVGRTEELRPTDVAYLAGLSDGVAVARLADGIELSLVGKASTIEIKTGSRTSSLMPSRLDWLRGSPGLKAILAIAAAVFGAVVAVRERWLGEVL